jgi:multicomponent Na+:H+ antiporter subunit B
MPNYGSSNSPAQTHLSDIYLRQSPYEVGIPNVVTAILASYRGFDTLGETAVVFTAGIGVVLLLSGIRRRKRKTGNR